MGKVVRTPWTRRIGGEKSVCDEATTARPHHSVIHQTSGLKSTVDQTENNIFSALVRYMMRMLA